MWLIQQNKGVINIFYNNVKQLVDYLISSAGLSNDEVVELIQQGDVSFEDEFYYTTYQFSQDGVWKETLQKGNSGQMWTEELVYPFDEFEEEYED